MESVGIWQDARVIRKIAFPTQDAQGLAGCKAPFFFPRLSGLRLYRQSHKAKPTIFLSHFRWPLFSRLEKQKSQANAWLFGTIALRLILLNLLPLQQPWPLQDDQPIQHKP